MDVMNKCQTEKWKSAEKSLTVELENFVIPEEIRWYVTVEEPAEQEPFVTVVRDGQVEAELGIAFPQMEVSEIVEHVKAVVESRLV